MPVQVRLAGELGASRNAVEAALRQLEHEGLLVGTDSDRSFAWCRPTVAHIRWDSGPVLRRVVRWAANIGRGREDRRQTLVKAEFVDGGTVGVAKRG
jgi:DNA-binding transcriptional MocR family regulator